MNRTRDKAVGEQAANDHEAGDCLPGEIATDENKAGDHAARDNTTDESAASANPTGDHLPADHPAEPLRVTIMGLGTHGGGIAAARYWAQRKARVTITDRVDSSRLRDSLAQLDGLPLAGIHLGSHPREDFTSADVVVVNPAVSPDEPLPRLARQHGARLTTEVELFLNQCPARVIAVSGTNGKSTTAAMIAAILTAHGQRVWLGGNIGRSLLGDLEWISPGDWVVLELSSFQLARLPTEGIRLHGVVLTNCTSNHLDWHGDVTAYVAAKQRLLAMQDPHGFTILNPEDPVVSGWTAQTVGRVVAPLDEKTLPLLKIPGVVNRTNAALAAAAAMAGGCDSDAVQRGLSQFEGLPHRLQFVTEKFGRRFYDDSQATTPESSVVALETIDGPLWLLVGGKAKGSDFTHLIQSIGRNARGVACYGDCREHLATLLTRHGIDIPRVTVERLEEALAWTWEESLPGDAVLLSPACASFDQFRDLSHRAEHFRAWIDRLG